MTAIDDRARFAQVAADPLAEKAGANPSTRLSAKRRSSRFNWYQDERNLTLVVGAQEQSDVDRALAVGLAERGGRDLGLVLPRGLARADVASLGLA